MPLGSGPARTIFVIVLYIILGLFIWMVIASGIQSALIKYTADRSDPSSKWYNFPSWIQPNDMWHNYVGYPNSYSNVIGYVATYTSQVKRDSRLTKVSPADCMLACAGLKEECMGFLFNTTSNTCTLYEEFDGLVPSDSSNVMFVVEGSEPTKQYTKSLSNVMQLATATIATLKVDTTTNVATVTTTAAHGFSTGNYVRIDGNTAAGGSNVITVKDTTNFTFPYPVTDTATVNGGTANQLPSSLATVSGTTYLNCAALCTSNISCTGFAFASDGSCVQYDIPLDSKKFTRTDGTDLYISGEPNLTSSSLSYY